jgi:hypothetical protein
MKAAFHSSPDIMLGQGSPTAEFGQQLLLISGFDCD